MAELFYLPKMGQTMSEGTILKWLKQEGEHVEGWEEIVSLMTDKVDMGVEPQITGTLRKILAPEGSVVPVGAAIAVIGAPDEDISALLSELSGAPMVGTEASEALLSQIDEQPANGAATNGAPSSPAPAVSGVAPLSASDEIPSVSPRAREVAREAGIDWRELRIAGTGADGMIVERDVVAYLASQPEVQPGGLATPLAAKMASDLGLPVSELPGSGPRGRVMADDVRRAASRKPAAAIEARDVPLQGMRKIIAQRLAQSYQQAVHVPLRVDVDMTAAADLRKQLKPALEVLESRLTYTDLIAAASAMALTQIPALNATLENDVIRIHPSVNLGIAVALDEGLTVPVVRDAQVMRLPELSAAIQDAAKKARTGQLPPDAFSGGTFTISNLGQYGIDNFDPIINPPQVAILGVGRIVDRVIGLNGAPAVRPMLTLTLCFDHRATDGAPAAQLLAAIKDLLENPARLML